MSYNLVGISFGVSMGREAFLPGIRYHELGADTARYDAINNGTVG